MLSAKYLHFHLQSKALHPLKNTVYVDDDENDRQALTEGFTTEKYYIFLALPKWRCCPRLLPTLYMYPALFFRH